MQNQDRLRNEGCKWLVVVTSGCVWVCMGVYGYLGVEGHEKQTRKDTHGLNVHHIPATIDGKFPKIHVWESGDAEGQGMS